MTLGRTIPALPVVDLPRALAFYRDIVGFSVPHFETAFAVLQRDEAVLHLWLASDTSWWERSPGRSPVHSGAETFLAGTASCRIETDAVDELFAEIEPTGALHPVSHGGVIDTWYGAREVNVLDPDGNLITFFAWSSVDQGM